jgi:hypothetical protein
MIMQPQQLGTLQLEVAPGKYYEVAGGPYVAKPKHMTGVKMALEVKLHNDGSHEISIPTKDFSVPDVKTLQRGLRKAVWAIVRGKPVYVGCMAGRGRTGLFLSVLARSFGYGSPIQYVRSNYYSHAVETADQMLYVLKFPIPWQVKALVKYARFRAAFTWWPCLTKTN